MKNASTKNLIHTTLLAVIVCALPALAGEDIYGVGNGHNGALNVSANNTVINAYARVTVALAPGATTLTVSTTSGFAVNDVVMIIQTTGIVPEPASGGPTNIDLSSDQVGRFELARLSGLAGTTLTMTQPLLYSYAANVTQIVRVPEYTDVTIGSGSLISRTWDGSTGGILAFLATGTVTINATISVTSRGFRGGQFAQDTSAANNCSALDETAPKGAQKGEGIAVSRYGPTQTGRGRVANGAGGGVCFKSGGGGGGNGGSGGDGGNSADGARAVGGQGGASLSYPAATRLTLGGGGGPSHITSSTTTAGGQGGGIIFIRAKNLTGSGSVLADGFFSQDSTQDGGGGGGGGGTIHMRFSGTASCTPSKVHAFGGQGGSTNQTAGPGGGGGGGRVVFQACGGAPLCPLGTANVIGGFSGVQTGAGGEQYGATSGGNGAYTLLADCYSPLTAPVVVTPANGSSTNDNTPTYTGTLALPYPAGTEVIIYVDGVELTRVTPDSTGNWTFTQPTSLAEGTHTVYAVAINTAQNLQSSPSSTNTFSVDSTPPPAPVVTAPANGSTTKDSTPDYTGTAEPNSTVTVIVDGVVVGTTTANASGNWTFTPTTPLADGPHTVKARATDPAGNTGSDSNTNTFTMDTVPPAAPVVVTPANGSRTNDNTPTYSGTAEPGTTVTVIVDGTPVGTTTANASGNWSFTPTPALADGVHSVSATAADAVGNVSPQSNTNTFTVDTTPPPAPVVVTPANGSTTSDNTPTYSGTAEANSTVTVFVDGTSVGTATADASGNWSHTPATPLADGSHMVKAQATDVAGNIGVDSNTNTLMVDTVPPAAPVVTTPANGSTSNDNMPTYTGTAEPNSTVTVILDEVAVGITTASPSGNWIFTSTTLLTNGSHTVRVFATDVAGNSGTSSNANTFTVGTISPPLLTTPANGSSTNDNTPTYSGTAEAGSTVSLIVDGMGVGIATANNSGAWILPQRTVLTDGIHTVRGHATNGAGNTSADSNNNIFTVDTTPPDAPLLTTPANNSSINRLNFNGTAEEGSTITVIVDGEEVGIALASISGAWSFLPPMVLPDGPHTVKARATDRASNASADSNTNTFTVDITPPKTPQVITPDNGSLTNDNTPAYSGTAETGSTVSLIVDSVWVGTAPVNASGVWIFPQPTLADGFHTLRAQAMDGAGNTSTDSNTNIFEIDTIPPAAPMLTTPANNSKTSQPIVYSGTAEAESVVKVFVDEMEVGTTISDSTWRWTLEKWTLVSDGSPHTIKVQAIDPAGNTSPYSNTNTFTVDTSPPAVPVVTSPGSSVDTETPIIGGTAEADSRVSVWLDGNEAKAAFITTREDGTWSFTPTTRLSLGRHLVTAIAMDEVGNTSLPPAEYSFAIQKSHYGWGCTTAPAFPATWALLLVASAFRSRWLKSPCSPRGSTPTRRERGPCGLPRGVRPGSAAAGVLPSARSSSGAGARAARLFPTSTPAHCHHLRRWPTCPPRD
ncbi:adventurous gliding motility protein AgmC [Hyalangium versicolor]|uniref:adventurous gliding motility protein AgmC n=1 Tax=Hyalangium versicolor TaxID=2861190 RepID=UPI001CCB43AF|nr:Ig-like domain-containing protein [Hyalangium versicolor]